VESVADPAGVHPENSDNKWLAWDLNWRDTSRTARTAMKQVSQREQLAHIFCRLDKFCSGAYALFADTPLPRTAVIFVHGFSGGPTETWTAFQSMIDSHAEQFPYWKSSDGFFFTYGDVLSSIDDSADRFNDFLDLVFPSLSQEVLDLLPELATQIRAYESLVLIGHSEGAVVIRAAIANAAKKFILHGKKKAPILDARVSLFAPAHLGFVPTSWLGAFAALTNILELANIAIAFSTPASEMHDKSLLLQLKEITERLFQVKPEVPALTAHVLFGSDEHVVVRSEYYQDCRHDPERAKDHRSICKPSADYQRPLGFVIGDCPE
jgi:hypothetical protein